MPEIDPEQLRLTLDRVLARKSVVANAETIHRSPRSTIQPDTRDSQRAAAKSMIDMGLPTGPAVAIKEKLGEGGMGIVHLAEQRRLGRDVALKVLKPDAQDARMTQKLLQEAWITGLLDHPSVVPIHDITLDADGSPQIVMQRISGVPWEALMHAPEVVKKRFARKDLLEWNLDVFTEVCHAVAYAHDKGIVHRDLKPENVMIGEYGEVYVVDWGLAVMVDDDPTERLPHVSKCTEMAGTPVYMAPEMLGGEVVSIGRHTDIYLLGAILHEIVSGEPPHMGEELHEIIQKIILSAPEQPPGTAPELVRLVRKAMRPEPSDRIPTARALRRSVRDFMRHQGSRRLESEAVAREAELEAQLATLGESPTRAEFTEVDRLYAECRFGYRTAVEAWPENPTAGGSLESLSVRMANFYISRHEPALAASVLSGVPNPPAELQRQVAEAAAAEDARKEQLEALDRDMSLDTGSRTRTFLAFCLGLLWTIGPLLRPALAAQDPDGYYGLILLPTAFMCIGTGAAIWARESMTASRLNRFILATLTVVFTAELFFAMAAWRLGIPADQTLSLTFLFWALAAAMIGIGADVRIAPTAFAYVAGFFLSLQLPAYRYYITSACNAFTTLYTVLVWAPPDFLRRRVSSLGWRGDVDA